MQGSSNTFGHQVGAKKKKKKSSSPSGKSDDHKSLTTLDNKTGDSKSKKSPKNKQEVVSTRRGKPIEYVKRQFSIRRNMAGSNEKVDEPELRKR